MEDRWTVLVGADKDRILTRVNEFEPLLEMHKDKFGRGDASRQIVFRMYRLEEQND